MRIGSLFSGYGGLDLAVQQVIPAATVAWHCDNNPGAARILAHHWTDVPNLGDVTAVDWAAVEPVDMITGGSPCPDISVAGAGAGMTAGTRSNLWVAMREAISFIRPRYVFWENVGGAYSAKADSALESTEGRVGDDPGGPVLRALGRVLGDLASLGYDAGWHGLRAADVGAPHGRLRVFVLATSDANDGGCEVTRAGGWGAQEPEPSGDRRPAADANSLRLERSGRSRNGRQRSADGDPRSGAVTLLPTPRATRGGSSTETVALLPTNFGAYAEAVAHWEALTRPAPPPVTPGKRQLNPAFSEWMMGLPAGHVTAVPGLSRSAQLTALGNGVVPQQGAEALRRLLRLATQAVAS